MSRFETVAPLMIYVKKDEVGDLKRFAKQAKKPVSQICREGIRMRMSDGENSYTKGFEDGLKAAIEAVLKNEGAKFMFPSGKTFAEMVVSDIEKLSWGKKDDQGTD